MPAHRAARRPGTPLQVRIAFSGAAGDLRGAQRGAGAPGTTRRFVRIMQQLDLTYDTYGMPGTVIVQLLPPEFDEFRDKRGGTR